jgi:acyl-coenzyme A synthetase/AMP-(fatty) acid ligase
VANIGDYETTHANFEWETPERFNFGRDVVDALPEDQSAMIWLGINGDERRLTFGDFSRLSNKLANAMKDLGIERGDRVMVTLGKVPEWHATLLGLLKLGAIAIPSSPMLRASDLKFRTEHSGATALISGPESTEEIEKIRDEVPNLRHLVRLGEEREGWESYEKLVDEASESFTAEDTASDEGALLLYTSGTTKHPKGALHTHGYTHARRTTGFGAPPRAAGPRPYGTYSWAPGAGAQSCLCTKPPSTPRSAWIS